MGIFLTIILAIYIASIILTFFVIKSRKDEQKKKASMATPGSIWTYRHLKYADPFSAGKMPIIKIVETATNRAGDKFVKFFRGLVTYNGKTSFLSLMESLPLDIFLEKYELF